MSPIRHRRPSRPTAFRLFVPILAGASLRERVVACCGALVSIALTWLVTAAILDPGIHVPMMVAPMGAATVLLFVVPASPMAQPWPLLGGNILSALVGAAVGRWIHDPALAAGLAVTLAIGAMSLAGCLHPPGAAVALTAILGGPEAADAGFLFPLLPVAPNCLVLLASGWIFHRLSGRSWPYVDEAAPVRPDTADPPSRQRVGFRAEDIDAALADLGETFDIDPRQLERLLRRVELRALERSHSLPACGEIMSRDVITVGCDTQPDTARDILLRHGMRALPVLGPDGRIAGTVGLRELFGAGVRVAELMSPPVTCPPDRPAIDLTDLLTDGRTHAVTVVDEDGRILGVVTQTDLLAVLSHSAARSEPPGGPAADI
ncbi:membrane protein [Allostella sp. ATCC 35155]|nr:membrane protein [Stella sp. ATCC 35155]